MSDKYRNKYNVSSSRLKNYDYGDNGSYFITICTRDKVHYFGTIISQADKCILAASEIGKIASDYCLQIPKHYSFVVIDEYIVMPNHIHMILSIQKDIKTNYTANIYGPQSGNLSAIIRAYKSTVKKYANENNIPFEWQPSYYEHIIKNESSYLHIINYIQENPNNWIKDKFNI